MTGGTGERRRGPVGGCPLIPQENSVLDLDAFPKECTLTKQLEKGGDGKGHRQIGPPHLHRVLLPTVSSVLGAFYVPRHKHRRRDDAQRVEELAHLQDDRRPRRPEVDD